MTAALPRGWSLRPLAELLLDREEHGPLQGWSPQCSANPRRNEGEWGVIKTTAIQAREFLAHENKALPSDLEPRSNLQVQIDDVLITRAGPRPRVGITCMVRQESARLLLCDKAYRLRFRKDVAMPSFMEALFNSPSVLMCIEAMKTGTSENGMNLTQDKLLALPCPLPSTDQQRRIVERIEALTQKSRRAKDALDAIPPLLERFRQSVLASAFRGDLTKDWRAQHPDVEPADKLLSRIRQERRHRWEQAELAKLKAKGKLPTDDRWKQNYEEPAPVDADGLPELPTGWCWTSLESLTDPVRLIRYGILMPGDDVPNGIPYVKVKHMRGDAIVPLAELPRTTKAMSDKFAGALLAVGDLLLSIRGTYGRVAIVENELAGANITQDSARVAPMPGVEKNYLAAILRSPESQRYFDRIAKGVAVRGINIGDIRPMPIPLAPREEQSFVALAAQRACGAIDAIASEVLRARQRNSVLDASILAKAFRGELTSNLSND